MKHSQLFILIANMFIVGSFFQDGIGTLLMIMVAFMWMIGSIFAFAEERTLDRLENLKKRLEFEMILDLLSKKKK